MRVHRLTQRAKHRAISIDPAKLAKTGRSDAVDNDVATRRREQLMLLPMSDRCAEQHRTPGERASIIADFLRDQRVAARIEKRSIDDQAICLGLGETPSRSGLYERRDPDPFARRLGRLDEEDDVRSVIQDLWISMTRLDASLERRERLDTTVRCATKQRPIVGGSKQNVAVWMPCRSTRRRCVGEVPHAAI